MNSTQDLVERLRAFAAGCRGSMWQSRDETIRLCDEASTQLTASRAECEGLRAAFKKTEYSLTKDSLCEAEKIDDALYVVRAALSQKETGDADR